MSTTSSHLAGSPAAPSRADRSPRLGDALRSFLALLGIEIRRSQGYWLLPLMVGPMLILNRNMGDPNVVLWPQLSHFILQSYLVVGPLAAGLAAWLIDRDRRRKISGLVSATSMTPVRRDLLLLVTASFWGVAGYALVAAWYGVLGVTQATWGGPDLSLIATGALAVIAYAAIGLLTGRLVPGKFSSLVAVAATRCLAIAIDYLAKIDSSYRFLTPFGLTQHNEPSVYYRNEETYIGPSLIWLGGLIGLLISIIALLRSRQRLSWTSLVISMGIAVSGLAPILAYDNTSMFANSHPISYELSCTTTPIAEVCVHPAYEARLDETTGTLVRMLEPVAGLDGVPTRWILQDPTDPTRRGVDGAVLFDLSDVAVAGSVQAAVFLDKTDRMAVTTPQLVILQWLSDRADIPRTVPWPYGWPSEVPSTTEEFADSAMGIGPDQAQLDAFAPQFDAAVARFAALGPDEQRAWLEANWDALRAGELSLEDLP